jgi:hypothetical protein
MLDFFVLALRLKHETLSNFHACILRNRPFSVGGMSLTHNPQDAGTGRSASTERWPTMYSWADLPIKG